MTKPTTIPDVLSPELLLRAYSIGVFPMSESRFDPNIFWVDPRERGVLPLDGLHVPRSLKKVIRQNRFEIRIDTAFADVIRACSAPRPDHPDTWINDEIIRAYSALHNMGFAHSVECWRNDILVGGLYGVRLQSAFFGESMFSLETDASKVALVHLVARLRLGGFRLLDCQFITEHLQRLGAIEIPARDYQQLLSNAMESEADFQRAVSPDALSSALEDLFLQSSTQRS